jgi:hypothetical protein
MQPTVCSDGQGVTGTWGDSADQWTRKHGCLEQVCPARSPHPQMMGSPEVIAAPPGHRPRC